MSDCCATDTTDASPCPTCGQTGPIVGEAPVRPHRSDATTGPWKHCQNTNCPIVYYLDTDHLTDSDVITQVSHKATDKPTPVCFCFAHTPDSLAADLEANAGVSTAKISVKAAVAEGFCACEHLNPSGQCCLPDIHRALKAIKTSSPASA